MTFDIIEPIGSGAMCKDTLATDKAYRVLEEEIVTLRLAPGAIFAPGPLAKQLGLDPEAVRCAMNRLTEEGLARPLARGRVQISAIDTISQLQLLEVRRRVECLAAALAAESATDSERDRFRALDASFRQVMVHKDDVVFLRLDRAFNQLLVEASRNPYCMSMLRMIEGQARRYFFKNREALQIARTAQLHADIAAAVAAGAPAAAEKAVHALLDYNEQHALRATRPS